MEDGLITMTTYDLLYIIDTVVRIIMMSSITILVVCFIRYARRKRYVKLIEEFNGRAKWIYEIVLNV